MWAVPMDDRKRRVLRAIVTLYGADGEPVGSGLLAEQFGHAVSSATLRNEMAALTKLGLLEQPHTSAGRVPSAKGYRYYIDNLLDTGARLPAEEKRQIDLLFREMDYDPERLAESAARALADLTGYCVVATTPKSEDLCIAHYEVMQVGRYTAAVLAVTNAGGVRTRTAKLDFALRPGDAQRLSQALNTYLTFRSAADVREEQMRTAAQSLGSAVYYPVLSAAVTLLREAAQCISGGPAEPAELCRACGQLPHADGILQRHRSRQALRQPQERAHHGAAGRRTARVPHAGLLHHDEALSRGRRADGGHRHRRSNAHALPGNDPAA